MSAAQTSVRSPRHSSAFGAEARRRPRCLRNASACGRARLPAHRRGSRQGERIRRWLSSSFGVRSFAPAAAFGGMPPICSLALELFMSVFPLWFALARNVEPSSAKMRKTGHQVTTTKIGQARAGFCRFTERSLFRLRSSRLPQASLLCERIRRSRNGSRACAALNNQPVRFPVTRSLPIEGVLTPPLAAMSSSNLVKSSYQSLAGRPCSPLPVNS